MTREEAYRAGWEACMAWAKFILPKELWEDAYGAVAWRRGFTDAREAPLGTAVDERAADYYEGDYR